MQNIVSKNKNSLPNLNSLKPIHSDFEILSFEKFTTTTESFNLPQQNNFYTLIVITDGKGSNVIDFENYAIKTGRIFFINYGQIYLWKKVENAKGYMVLFTQEFYNLIFTGNPKIKSDSILSNTNQFVDVKPNQLKEWLVIFKLMQQEYLDSKVNYKEIVCLLLKTLVLKFNQFSNIKSNTYLKANRKNEIVLNYKNLINQHFKNWKLPKFYAVKLFITANYLNAICNQIVGVSATKLIEERVILEAKRLLTHTDFSVTQIAMELGFEDNSHFGKYFKKVVKETPDKFRNIFLQKN